MTNTKQEGQPEDWLDEILKKFYPVHVGDFRAKFNKDAAVARAAIEAHYNARFDKALGEHDMTMFDDEGTRNYFAGVNETVTKARKAWYGQVPEGEG